MGAYRAFVIGVDGLAIEVHEVDAQSDADALEKAKQLLGRSEHLEVWCGSRKVGDNRAGPSLSER
jgi:hypothetical protein